MYLENVVIGAVDTRAVGQFWEVALGGQPLTDETGNYETRLSCPGGPDLDLCFELVPDAGSMPLRLHLDLHGGIERDAVASRLRALGAADLDIGQGDVPWLVMADPAGMPFCVMEERAAYRDTGPIAALPLDSADPQRDGIFWAHLTGWVEADGVAPVTLRHPSLRGPLLELCSEPAAASGAQNRLHLDVRLDPGEDSSEAAHWVLEHGGTRFEHDWGELPWQVFLDPSGNIFCILPSRG